MNDSKVIIVSGVTASGKTTLISKLREEFPSSKVLSFDDYEIDQLPTTPKIDTPLNEAVDQYDISLLMNDFLKVYNNCPLIFIDFPFGNRHPVLKSYINKTFYIKTPLDIAFARQIIRDYSKKSTEDIVNWAKKYIEFARPIFIDHENYISQSADIVLDGTLSIEENIRMVKQVIGNE